MRTPNQLPDPAPASVTPAAGRPERHPLAQITRTFGCRMAYLPDPRPYAHGSGNHPGVVHVGWLDGTRPYAKGHVAFPFVEGMKKR